MSEGDDPAVSSWHRYAWAIALGITALGFLLRVGGVYQYWINGDEGIYYTVSHAATWTEASASIHGNAHPPLFYYLLRVLASLSTDYTVLRLPSLLAGTASIYLLFTFTRQLAGPIAGLVAAAMAALSTGLIMLSQTARPYMVQLVLLILALSCLVRFLDTRRSRDAWGYVLLTLFAVFVHYSTFQVVGGVGLVLLFLLLRGRINMTEHRALLLAQVPIVLGIAILYFVHIRPQLMGGELQTEATQGWLKPYFMDGLPRLLVSTMGLCQYASVERLYVAPTVVLLAGLLVGFLKPDYRLVASLCAATLGLAIFLSFWNKYPYGGHRHSMYLMCLVIPVAAIGLSFLATRSWRWLAGTALALTALVVLDDPISDLLRIDPKNKMPRELSVLATEVDELSKVLDAWNDTPGIYLTDMQTAYALAPLLQDARANLKWAKAGSNVAYFPWKNRILIIASTWSLEAGRGGVSGKAHLGVVLDSLPTILPEHCSNLVATDVRIISSQGPKLPNQAERFRKGLGMTMLIDPNTMFAGNSYSFFRIDAGRYRAGWVEAVRRASDRGR